MRRQVSQAGVVVGGDWGEEEGGGEGASERERERGTVDNLPNSSCVLHDPAQR